MFFVTKTREDCVRIYKHICVLHDVGTFYICIKRNERKKLWRGKNPLKYNVLPVSNADVKKVDEDYFLSRLEKR